MEVAALALQRLLLSIVGRAPPLLLLDAKRSPAVLLPRNCPTYTPELFTSKGSSQVDVPVAIAGA